MVDPRTDVQSVKNEPGFDAGDLTDDQISTKMEDATRIVERRIGDEFEDESLLERVETLVTCHLLTPALTGATQGKQVEQVTQGTARIQYAINDDLPAGIDSPFWQDAVRLTDGKINHIDGPGVVGVR